MSSRYGVSKRTRPAEIDTEQNINSVENNNQEFNSKDSEIDTKTSENDNESTSSSKPPKRVRVRREIEKTDEIQTVNSFIFKRHD